MRPVLIGNKLGRSSGVAVAGGGGGRYGMLVLVGVAVGGRCGIWCVMAFITGYVH